MTIIVAFRIVRALVERLEHHGTRKILAPNRSISIILEKVTAIEHSQSDILREVGSRGYVPKYIAVGFLLPVLIGLLKSKLYEELEEILGIEAAADVRGPGSIEQQHQHQGQEPAQLLQTHPGQLFRLSRGG